VSDIILVDDCSRDDTVKVAAAIPGVTVIRHPANRGYGGNQKTCYATALERGADVVIMIHPDFQYDPSRVPQMIAPLIAGTADMVLGSRFLEGDPRRSGMVWWRFYANRFLTKFQNLMLGTHLSECHSGYRAYTADLLRQVPFQKFSDDFAFDSQMIAAVARRKLRIGEVAIPVRYLSDSSSISFSRSVRYGLSTLLTLMPWVRV
ncbi:MAG TPA: glycosyltransferase family 2 protein, partial [Candidatus Peribacteria bacterium]|nr:glycosyltransferase family 2 protein [Candidatus Peribacteria bacterium]